MKTNTKQTTKQKRKFDGENAGKTIKNKLNKKIVINVSK